MTAGRFWRTAMLTFIGCQCMVGYSLHAADNGETQSVTSYEQRLALAKHGYPFDKKWKNNFEAGLKQYTLENRAKAEAIANRLIDGLIDLGAEAAEAQKMALFKEATLALNRLNEDTDHSLIETTEAKELVLLFNAIAAAANIDHRKYGHGEGPASEWRDW